MGFDKREVIHCMQNTGNIPAAMVAYIARNGCSEFRCRKCPLGLVCDHYPEHSRGVAIEVIEKVSLYQKETQ